MPDMYFHTLSNIIVFKENPSGGLTVFLDFILTK